MKQHMVIPAAAALLLAGTLFLSGCEKTENPDSFSETPPAASSMAGESTIIAYTSSGDVSIVLEKPEASSSESSANNTLGEPLGPGSTVKPTKKPSSAASPAAGSTPAVSQQPEGPENSGDAAWREARNAAQFTGQALSMETMTLSREELTHWLDDPSSLDGTDHSEQFLNLSGHTEDGQGDIAYWGYKMTGQRGSEVGLYCCFADGTQAELPVPRESEMSYAMPETVVFGNNRLSYQVTFADNLYMDAYIHFAGTYTYTVDLNTKTVSLTIA